MELNGGDSMRGKTSLKIVSALCLVAILVAVVAVVSFQQGTNYQRYASLNLEVETGYCMHITVEVDRADGSYELLKDGVALNNAGVLTTIGKNYIEGKLGDSGYGDNAKFADDISLSCNGGAPDVAWTEIPVEIAVNGLDRTTATYTSTGNGVWTIHHQFTASDTHTDVQLTGLSWEDTDELDNVLLGADTFTPVTLNNGDKLTVTFTITVS